MKIMSLCDRTGEMVRPWADAGHDCLCVDLQDAPDNAPGEHVQVNVLSARWLNQAAADAGIVFAFPPCTDLAGSGARWWAQKGMLACFEAVHLVFRCRDICEASGVPWMIENPVGRLSTIWRKPDHTFDPCDYGGYLDPPGDAYTKRTCLWTGGGFVMPKPKRVEPVPQSENPIHRAAPGPERANIRSVTPAGFAQAVFEANR